MSNLIAILDEDGNQLFDTAVNIGVSVLPSKTFARHSLENKQVVIDDQYDNPTSLSMRVILNPSDYASVYNQIKEAYESVTSFIIQTKVDIYQNMFIESLPHEEDPSMFNTISMTLSFTEQLINEPDIELMPITRVSSPSDSDSVEAGQKSNTDDDGTVLQRLVGSVFG